MKLPEMAANRYSRQQEPGGGGNYINGCHAASRILIGLGALIALL
jgi:hypothetical protein